MILLGIISGCQKDMQVQESKPLVKSIFKTNFMEATYVKAKHFRNEGTPSLFVHYETRGTNLFVECIVNGISFREKDQSKQKVGKMIVWIDGKKSQEISSAAFVIKQLPSGNHRFKLEVVNLQNVPYGISKEFMVNIPKK